MLDNSLFMIAGCVALAVLLLLIVFLVWRIKALRSDLVCQAQVSDQLARDYENSQQLIARSELDRVKQQSDHEYISQSLGAKSESLNILEAEFRRTKDELDQLSQTVAAQAAQLEEVPRLRATVATKDTELARLQTHNADLQSQLAELHARYEEQAASESSRLKTLNEAQDQARQQFENLANKIFEEKAGKLNEQSKQSLETSVGPLREQLTDFKRKVEEVYEKETRDRVALRTEILQLKSLNQQISDDASNLTKALKGDVKAQGNWGEVILERVLDESGLRKGHEYETQASFVDEHGKRKQPDVILHLPEGKDIVIDAKVSLIAYERYVSADTDEARASALKEHVQSVSAHISGLSKKSYENLPGIRSLDFVFIFMPIEAAFMLTVEHEPELFRKAYDNNIVLVSPTTLLTSLRTVENIWRFDRQNKNAEQIAIRAGGLHDQFVMVVESIEDLGKLIDRSHAAHEQLTKRIKTGKGNLIKRTLDLQKLGAKTKKQLPQTYLDEQEIQDSPAELPLQTDSIKVEHD